MAGTIATIETEALTAFAARLRGMRDALGLHIDAANGEIGGAMQDVLRELYGERLARYWNVQTFGAESSGALARVRLWSFDKKVRGYEFGTRPHLIAVHAGKRALAFQWHGEDAFYQHVDHPGTRAHNKRETLKTLLGMTARESWRTAIEATLRGG